MLNNKEEGTNLLGLDPIRIELFDECTFTSIGFESLLSSISASCVFHRAHNLSELKKVLVKDKVQVLVIEPFSMGRNLFQTIELIHWIKGNSPEAKIVILTQIKDKAILRFLYNTNINVLISKSDDLIEISKIIAQALQGSKACSRTIRKLLNSQGRLSQLNLTNSELTVLNYTLLGITQKKIADLTNRSTKTISCHKRNAMRKLGVKGNTELVAFSQKASGNHLIKYHSSEIKSSGAPLFASRNQI
ncbi:helix-turn-helix transcriptional regulator [Serratia aquatilis]|uniref:LuxR C-terminal-related transcriptional regulator n=1 Tax=Serratia aquatilis TaxID=1737515 RepID=A0ABV6EEW6_9GAMM